MEEKKSNGISASAFFLIIAIIVIIAMGYFVYKFYNDKEALNKENTELKEKTSNLNLSTNENDSIANDENEAIEQDDIEKTTNSNNEIIELTSIIDTKEDSRTIDMYGTEYSVNMKWELLQVNIDSEDAKTINKKIKDKYEKAINSVSSSENFVDYESLEYEISNYNSILSILVKTLECPIPGGDTIPEYEVYNFDVKTGNLINVDEVFEEIGLSRESFNQKFKEIIEQNYNSMTSSNYKIDEAIFGSNFEEYYSKFNLENLKCLIYSSKKMKIICGAPSGYGVTINEEMEMEY